MKVRDVRAALEGAPDEDLVMGIGDDLLPQSIVAVRVEPQSDDGEGHATSTGGTVWLALESA